MDTSNHSLHTSFSQGSEFLQGFRSADQNRFADAWDEIQRPQIPHSLGRDSMTNIPLEHGRIQPSLDGNPEMSFSINSMRSLLLLLVKVNKKCFRG